MQLKVVPALLIFVGSYLPLAIVLALQDIPSEAWNSGLCLALENCTYKIFSHPATSVFGLLVTGLCFALTLLVLNRLDYPFEVQLSESKPIPSELISYSFPYIVSFIGVDYGSPGKIAGLIVFLAWLFLITYRAGQIIMNPLLLVFGWNLYESKIKSTNAPDKVVRVLSRQKLSSGTYKCQLIQSNYICKDDEK